MALRLLADQNIPLAAVIALRDEGHDVAWVQEIAPASPDPSVLEHAQRERRILLTFDKDFGELAFRVGLPTDAGVILVRFASSNPEILSHRLVEVLGRREDWAGNFSVIEDDRVRMTPLP